MTKLTLIDLNAPKLISVEDMPEGSFGILRDHAVHGGSLVCRYFETLFIVGSDICWAWLEPGRTPPEFKVEPCSEVTITYKL